MLAAAARITRVFFRTMSHFLSNEPTSRACRTVPTVARSNEISLARGLQSMRFSLACVSVECGLMFYRRAWRPGEAARAIGGQIRRPHADRLGQRWTDGPMTVVDVKPSPACDNTWRVSA